MPPHRRVALALVAFGVGGLLTPLPKPDAEPAHGARKYALALSQGDDLRLARPGLVAESNVPTLACRSLFSFGALDVGVRCATVARRATVANVN